jgi:hypothetical protein
MFTLPAAAPVSTFVAPAADPRFAAESAMSELLGHVHALRLGLAPFDILTPEERDEQLAQLIDTNPPVVNLSNEELIALIAEDASTPFPRLLAATQEIDRRLKVLPVTVIASDAPDEIERFRIESDDEQYHRELTMRHEQDVMLDTPLAGRTGW